MSERNNNLARLYIQRDITPGQKACDTGSSPIKMYEAEVTSRISRHFVHECSCDA